ncbi:MAG: hypothetical protein CM1200mP34_5510 [Verrucomicrobiales bacterium]|nr:MAG: hypothetical protein CM1200mP34_5510 [Verrucomicrobiales bacterium]
MIEIAEKGDGRFYNITNPAQLPQIFLKETAVILKTAIYEEPFTPQQIAASEALTGFARAAIRRCSVTWPRARNRAPRRRCSPRRATHCWRIGSTGWGGSGVHLRRSGQVGQPMDRLGAVPDVLVATGQLEPASRRDRQPRRAGCDRAGQRPHPRRGDGAAGNYRNFLDLQAVVVGPKGGRELVPLKQTAAGRYEAAFETRETGAYLVHLREMENGELRASQVIGANLDHSPEFAESRPNLARLERLAEIGGGKLLSRDFDADNPFERDRHKTFQPVDLWEWLLKFAVILFPIDVGVRRIQLDWEEWFKATAALRRLLFFWRRREQKTSSDESLASLLAKRDEARQTFQRDKPSAPEPGLFEPERPVAKPPPKPSAPPRPSRKNRDRQRRQTPPPAACSRPSARRAAAKNSHAVVEPIVAARLAWASVFRRTHHRAPHRSASMKFITGLPTSRSMRSSSSFGISAPSQSCSTAGNLTPASGLRSPTPPCRPTADWWSRPTRCGSPSCTPASTTSPGNWLGRLANNGETIRLVDATGTTVDKVRYATEGDWARRFSARWTAAITAGFGRGP